jgi:PAS domain S-box-containing protein
MKSNNTNMNWDDSDRDTIEALLNAALDSNFSSLMLTGAADGYPIEYVNPAFTELTGYTAEEVIGKNPGLLQGPKTDRDLLKELRDKIDEGQAFHGRTVNYRKDGSEFTMEWKVYPINNANKETTHYLAVQRAA